MQCTLGIGIQEFSTRSPSWKYADNWKGLARLSREGFLRRGTTEACLKQKATVRSWSAWLVSLANSVENTERVRFYVPLDTK